MDQSEKDRRKIRKLAPHQPDKLTCTYCGKVKDEFILCIGASKEPDWCIMEGTGKITCPTCYPTAQAEAAAVFARMSAKP